MHSEEEYYNKADNLMRICCEAVQGVFRDTWERRTGSEWTKASAMDLITGDGKAFYSKCEFPPQKRLLEEGKVEEWDLTLLFGLLKCLAAQGHRDRNWRRRKAALHTVCGERNKLAHNARKKITAAAYQQVEASVRDSLSKLGVNEEKVHKWISDAEVAFDNSSDALEQATKLEELGDKEYSRRNYQGAKVHYDEALLVPSLSSVKLCALHEKRAGCFLELGRRERNVRKQTGLYDQAQKDIGEALSGDESSWKAHSIQAKIYRARNEVEKAIEHLEESLAIRPAQAALLKDELDVCKLEHGGMARHEHMAYAQLPLTLEEVHAQHVTSTGRKSTLQEFLEFKNKNEKLFPGLGDVSAGDAYTNGSSVVEINYKEAARHYENAMAQGNVDGIYRLAYLYVEGKGVPRNIPYAIELLEKAADMPVKILVSTNSSGRDVARISHCARAACYSLGLKYEEGVGVGQDYKKALEWYKKAGGHYAANLGHMYAHGKGVPQDWKMAAMYFKQAVVYGSFNAALGLCNYYMDEGEPDLAAFWLEKSIHWGHFYLPFYKDTVEKSIADISRYRKEREIPVKEFESEHDLSTQELTFMQRVKRMRVTRVYKMAKEAAKANGSENAEAEAEECAKNYAKYFNPNPMGFGWSIKISEFEWTGGELKISVDSLDIISKGAGEGSVSAQRVMTVSGYIDHFYQLWNNKDGTLIPEDIAQALMDLVYQITCLEPHLFYFISDEMEDEFKSFIRSHFEAHGSDKGDLDMKLRICYAMYANDRGKHFGIAVLKEGIRRYPHEAVYYDQLSCLHGRSCEYKEGLDVVNQGLGRFPHDVGLLFKKAVHTRLLEETNEDVAHQMGILRSAYEDFIKVAPEDHRKLPEAYYCISRSYWDEMDAAKEITSSEKKNDKEDYRAWEDKVLEFYEMGKRAEGKQLVCYLPYESRTKALLVEEVLAIVRRKDPSEREEEWWTTCDGPLPKFISKNIEYMKDPNRIELVRQHRENCRDIPKMMAEYEVKTYKDVPTFKQKLPKSLAGLQEITLQDMNHSQEKIYEGKILNLTLIEDPLEWQPSYETVAIDDNGYTIRVGVFNVPFNEKTEGKLGFGTRLSVLNPYIQMRADWHTVVRVDDPRTILYVDKVENMCRYCGQGNAKYSCGKCGWAKYCDRECQVADWKELKHKLICKPKGSIPQ